MGLLHRIEYVERQTSHTRTMNFVTELEVVAALSALYAKLDMWSDGAPVVRTSTAYAHDGGRRVMSVLVEVYR